MKSESMKFTVKSVLVDDPKKLIPLIGGNVQLVTAECIEEVIFAALLAIRAFKRGTNHAKTYGGELLLRLAGTNQIKVAIEKNGVKRGLNYLICFETPEQCSKFLLKTGLVEVTPPKCNKENLKALMEKSALVETL
ncbi:MAG: hypothetical protein PWQ79_328 [Thermococcaceae archaeon]|nr:hypothetical protein [Thermococcaceae archaeon]MDK2913413.1 hypothetical protein [Thermococcaceae archaeon]